MITEKKLNGNVLLAWYGWMVFYSIMFSCLGIYSSWFDSPFYAAGGAITSMWILTYLVVSHEKYQFTIDFAGETK